MIKLQPHHSDANYWYEVGIPYYDLMNPQAVAEKKRFAQERLQWCGINDYKIIDDIHVRELTVMLMHERDYALFNIALDLNNESPLSFTFCFSHDPKATHRTVERLHRGFLKGLKEHGLDKSVQSHRDRKNRSVTVKAETPAGYMGFMRLAHSRIHFG